MELYTSYFNKVKNSNDTQLLVNVSNKVPEWFPKHVHTVPIRLCPSWDIITAFKSGDITYDDFCILYRQELLARTTVEDILKSLEDLTRHYNVQKVVLLCHEKCVSECHRAELVRILDYHSYRGEL